MATDNDDERGMIISRSAPTPRFRVVVLTSIALAAFAGNSVLCRMALDSGTIDAAGFSTIRLACGAMALFLLLSTSDRKHVSKSKGSWVAASMLFLYAVAFSFAYISLDTGTGALILFGMVQATMITGALLEGDRPLAVEWTGWLLALAGFIYLMTPGVTAPSAIGAALMGLAGVGWGIYSLRGRRESDALGGTTYNFVRSVPLVLCVAIVGIEHLHLSPRGIVLAAVSGALTSGVGYAIWYAALRGLTAIQAAMVQLFVPVLAAAGGIVFLSEAVSTRLVISGLLILGGIGVAVIGKETLRRDAARV